MVRDNLRWLSALLTLTLGSHLFSQTPLPDESIPESIPVDIVADWKKQDGITSDYAAAIEKIRSLLPDPYASKITGTATEADYLAACHWRRVAKLKPFMSKMNRVLYAKHYNMGGSLPGFLSGLSSDRGTNWKTGSGLYMLSMTTYYPQPEVLLEDAQGVIRDPCVSFDGKKVLFAWTKNSDGGGLHIFEFDVATKETRQITNNPLDLKVGDYEPCYLPTGDIMFNSSRSFGMVSCSYNTIGNLYICNKNGEWLRRVGFDQEATFYPTLMADGNVLYSRWEFNDRTSISSGGYFTMNHDGTKQTEYWGNQSDFPLQKYHGREIPNSNGKIMGIAGDHLAPYQGEIIVIDPKISRNNSKGAENESIRLIAPLRKVPVDPSTSMLGHSGGAIKYQFQNPWPFDENNCLVSWRSIESEKLFKIYFFSADGRRELFAWDSSMSVSQPIVMDERPMPPTIAPQADYSKETGVFQVNNVYHGTGSQGITAGKIVKLRVIALDYRTNYSTSSGILGFAVNPIGRAFSTWEVKTLLGEIPIENDGSACFIVPANTPVFFQTIDADGRMVNTMRSWSTLMPGERFTCTGCHENKNEIPPETITKNPMPLVKRLGVEDKGFSFPTMVQPILDRNCVKSGCHEKGHGSLVLQADLYYDNGGRKTFSTSYKNLTMKQKKYVDWITQESKAAPITTFPAPGSGTSPFADTLLKGHKNIKMTPEEREVLFCWIDMMIPYGGSYYEGMKPDDSTKYVTYLNNNRKKHIEWEKDNCKAFVDAGQWQNPIYHVGSGSAFQNRNRQKTLREISDVVQLTPFAGKLSVQCPGIGTISIIDMKGRVVRKVDITTKQQVVVLSSMTSGIYIVRFNGSGVVRQRMVGFVAEK